MSIEENKAFIHRMTEAFWNTGDLAVMEEFYSPEVVVHFATGPAPMEAYKKVCAAYFGGFPDLDISTDDLVAEGDKVVKRWTARCTHSGEYMGIPATGNKLEVKGIEIFRLADGKIAEVWASMDSLGMMQQLGVIPPLG
jgi:steroid delta-isomerase-like uncharacterized protein